MTTYCRQQSARPLHNRCDVTVMYTVDSGYSVLVASRRKIAGRDTFSSIGLPHDGKMIRTKTPHAMAVTLRMLREEGYSVPDTTLARLENEWMPA